MNCINCHQELKHPTEFRMGKICAKKAARAEAVSGVKKVRVELISKPTEIARRAIWS